MSSTTSTKITLFDIATTLPDSEPLSPFTARVRYVLNYKQLAYTTVWVHLKDIQDVCAKHGFKPTGARADGSPRYTLPAIIDETSGKAIALSDSYPIIKYLEKTYPDSSHPLFPAPASNDVHLPAIHMFADAYFKDTFLSKVFPLLIGRLHSIITPGSRDVWRKNAIGDKNIEDVMLKKGSKEYDEALGKLLDALKVVAGFMELNGGAKWLLGDKPTFIDFAILSFVRVPRLADVEVWEAIKGISGGIFAKYVEAGDVYMKWK